MNVDERLVVLRLCKNWCGRVERDELDLQHVWSLLLERIGAFEDKFKPCDICQMRPCQTPSWCESCRKVDQKNAASRKCAQCGSAGGSDLEPHKHLDRKTIVYLHRGACEQFWKSRNR